MNEQISLYNQDTDAFIGTISKDQFDVLTYYLKLAGDDVKQAENHKMNLRMLDIIEREAQRFAAEGAKPAEHGQGRAWHTRGHTRRKYG